ncbi:MAG: hypothetical protein OEO21_08735 [Candidatus Krumholzibacteria bacterium]|nr:hypothetical protein [Candidatus Krumholzibacteria bacterium]
MAGLLALGACAADTARLDPEQESRLVAQGIVLRADNLVFRHSEDVGRRDARWRDRVASIVVTRETVLIHESGLVDFLIERTTRRWVEVRRDRDRVRISAGTRGNTEAWSFTPPGDADAWARAIRAVIRTSRSTANP